MPALFVCTGHTPLPRTTRPATALTDGASMQSMRKVFDLRDESGVLACTIGNAFEMAPPLTATQDQLDRAVEATARAVHEVAKEHGLG